MGCESRLVRHYLSNNVYPIYFSVREVEAFSFQWVSESTFNQPLEIEAFPIRLRLPNTNPIELD